MGLGFGPGAVTAQAASLDVDFQATIASSPYAVPDSDTGGVINPGVTFEANIPVAGTDIITLRVPQAPDTKKFARLRVVINP